MEDLLELVKIWIFPSEIVQLVSQVLPLTPIEQYKFRRHLHLLYKLQMAALLRMQSFTLHRSRFVLRSMRKFCCLVEVGFAIFLIKRKQLYAK